MNAVITPSHPATLVMTQPPVPPVPPVPQPVPSSDVLGLRAPPSRRPAPLTAFDAEVELQLAACRRHGVKVAVTFLRLEGWHHLAAEHGDALMQSLAEVVQQRLQGRLRHVDRVARVSDDTFGVALFDARPNTLAAIETRLRCELSLPYRLGEVLATMTVVTGSAMGRRLGSAAPDLIRQAADACRRATD